MASSFYTVVFPPGLGFGQVIPHMISPPEVGWVEDPKCTYATVRHGTHYVPWVTLVVVELIGYLSNSLCDGVRSDVSWTKLARHAEPCNSLVGDTLRNTRSPTSNSRGRRLWSTQLFWRLYAVFILSQMTLILYMVTWIKSGLMVRDSSMSCQQSGVLHLLLYNASYGAIPILEQ